MIYENIMFSAKCDNCGEQWSNDDGLIGFTSYWDMQTNLAGSDWYVEYNKTYCPECYEIEEDSIIIKTKKND